MIFKKILPLTLSIVMSLSVIAGAKTLEFSIGSDTMYNSGEEFEKLQLQTAPYTKSGRTLVPVRVISEKFGASVDWDGEKREVSIKKDGKQIILTIGSNMAIVNGVEIALDVPAEITNNKTMVPLRFVSESLEMDVKYVASTRQVLISDEPYVLSVNGINFTLDDYKSLMSFNGYREGGDDKLDHVKTAGEIIKKLYSAAGELNNAGITAESNYAEAVAKELTPFTDVMYANSSLTASTADILEKEMFLVDYVSEWLDSDEGIEQIEKTYQENYISAKHILISSENITKAEAKKKAQGILKELKNGADFDKLMAEHGEDPGAIQEPNGYNFTKGEMVQEFEKAAFALEEGEISELVETSYGYHIIKRIPLNPIDYYSFNAIGRSIMQSRYVSLLELSAAASQIIQYKTDDQIAALIK